MSTRGYLEAQLVKAERQYSESVRGSRASKASLTMITSLRQLIEDCVETRDPNPYAPAAAGVREVHKPTAKDRLEEAFHIDPYDYTGAMEHMAEKTKKTAAGLSKLIEILAPDIDEKEFNLILEAIRYA